MTIERQALIDLNISDARTTSIIINDALNYFNRVDDHAQIRASIKRRFGLGIQQKKDPANKSAVLETYVRNDFKIQVDAGIIEAVGIGFGNKVVSALSNLHTEPGQRYSLHTKDESDVKKGELLLKANRDAGGFDQATVLADEMSIQVGCGIHYVTWKQGHTDYKVINPGSIQAYFAETVTEDGIVRSADNADLEDASVIIVRLNRVDTDKWNYLAVYGASDIHPQGRHVMFQDSENSGQVPDVGTNGAIDWYPVGDNTNYANPLTWYGQQNPDLEIPEYPFRVIRGVSSDTSTLFPVTFSLFNDSLEFDVGASHTFSCSQDAARGLTIIEVTPEGNNMPLPRTLVGVAVSSVGQTIKHEELGAKEAKLAWETQKQEMVSLGAGYAVPDYMISSEDHTLAAESGVALEIKSRPLKKKREQRIQINKSEIQGLFGIEKGMIGLYSEADEASINQLQNSIQRWEPGELKLPENKKEEAERIKVLSELGVLDEIAKLKEYYKLSSDTEAIELYEKMKDRKDLYPPLNETAPPVTNAGRGFRSRGNS